VVATPLVYVDRHMKSVRFSRRPNVDLTAHFEERSLHPDTVQANPVVNGKFRGCRWATEMECVVLRDLSAHAATIIRDYKTLLVEDNIGRVAFVRLTPPSLVPTRGVDRVVNEIKDAVIKTNVLGDHVNKERFRRCCPDGCRGRRA